MKKIHLSLCLLLLACGNLFSQNEPFTSRIINTKYQLNSAWELTYGPDDSLWVTENSSYLVSKINIANGRKTQLLDLSTNHDAFDTWPQGGLMGMALHPSMYDEWPAPSKPWVYLAYVYKKIGDFKTKSGNDSGSFFKTRIVRYVYDLFNHILKSPETFI